MTDFYDILDRFSPQCLTHPAFELADRRQSKRLLLGLVALCTVAGLILQGQVVRQAWAASTRGMAVSES